MGIYFLTYDYLVQQTMKKQHLEHRSQLSPTVPLLAGATAGLVLWLAVYPIDVIKSYMQTDALVPSERRFRGMSDVVRHVYATSGVNGFFRGIVPTLIRVRVFADAGTLCEWCNLFGFRAGAPRTLSFLDYLGERRNGLVKLCLPQSIFRSQRTARCCLGECTALERRITYRSSVSTSACDASRDRAIKAAWFSSTAGLCASSDAASRIVASAPALSLSAAVATALPTSVGTMLGVFTTTELWLSSSNT